jgi:hypothetical protein
MISENKRFPLRFKIFILPTISKTESTQKGAFCFGMKDELIQIPSAQFIVANTIIAPKARCNGCLQTISFLTGGKSFRCIR